MIYLVKVDKGAEVVLLRGDEAEVVVRQRSKLHREGNLQRVQDVQ